VSEENGPRHRTIRSFVRRTGRLTASQQKALEELWPGYGIEAATGTLDIDALFGRRAPTVLEIGFGNGDSLVEQAAMHPGWNFIGIEVHEPGVGHCLLRIRERELSNLRLIRQDAIEVLERQVAADSLERINLYFPDPWPKKRHHKRRILQPPFLELCARALRPGGTLHIATDWANYAEHIDALMAGDLAFECRETREHSGEAPLDRPRTRFEQRGLRHGHRIRDWIFVCGK
jgi:tRNA (guanine-N7-)-methyltransferase